jgi:uncharacterized membrane protein
MAERSRAGRGFLKWFRRKFFTGLLVVLPVVLTAYVLYRIFVWVDGILRPVIARHPYLDIPGLGFLGVIAVILLAGVLGGGILGRTLLRWLEGRLERIPMVRGIYIAIKQISEVFLKEERSVFDRVVIVEYPRPNVYMLGFVTANWRLKIRPGAEEDFLAVFIPTSPNPTSGFLVAIPPRDAYPTDLSVPEAFKVIVSGGAVVPGSRRAADVPADGTATPANGAAGR